MSKVEGQKEAAFSKGSVSVSLAVSRILRDTSSTPVGRCGPTAPTLPSDHTISQINCVIASSFSEKNFSTASGGIRFSAHFNSKGGLESPPLRYKGQRIKESKGTISVSGGAASHRWPTSSEPTSLVLERHWRDGTQRTQTRATGGYRRDTIRPSSRESHRRRR